MRIAISAVLLICFAACSTPYTIEGRRPGSTQADFSSDLLECRAMSKRVFGYEDKINVVQCMESKNWAVQVREG